MISAIVITKNEEEMLQGCLESLKWADEIIVADNDSSDKTLEITKKYISKILKLSEDSFASRRNKAVEAAKGDWILFVDADERVLQPLRDEIKEIVASDQNASYAISRRNIIFGTEVKYGPFWPDWVVRLFKKDNFKGYVGEIHEYPQLKGELVYTKNSLLHLTHRNVDQIVLKSLNWSKIDAKLRLESNHPKMSGWRFLRILISEIYNQGVKRKGFFSGTVGVMDSLLQTFSLIMTYVRLWELQRTETLNETYKKIDENLRQSGFKF